MIQRPIRQGGKGEQLQNQGLGICKVPCRGEWEEQENVKTGLERNDPNLTLRNVYFPEVVHQQRVYPCPDLLPSGFY